MKVARRLCSVLAVLLLAGIGAPEGVAARAGRAAQAAPGYRLMPMTGPLGEAMGGASTMNDRGQVLASVWSPSGAYSGVVWDARTAQATYVAPWWAALVVTQCPPFTTVAALLDISNQGLVVGSNGWPPCPPYIYVPPWVPKSTAFSWQSGLWLDLAYGPGQGSGALAVNDRGQVVGFEGSSGSGPGGGTVVAWQNGLRVPVPRPLWSLFPRDLNDRGQVLLTGLLYESDDSPPRSAIVIWDIAAGAITEVDLDLPPDTGVSSAGINERGQVIVSATTIGTASRTARTYLWDGEVVDLGNLGVVPGVYGSDAYGLNSKPLNDVGHVVVQGMSVDGEQHAFLWRDGKATDLGTLGGDYSVAYAINNRDEVVGQSRTAAGELHAFVWREGQMADLGALAGGGESRAAQINEAGQVLGARTQGPFDGEPLFWSPTSS